LTAFALTFLWTAAAPAQVPLDPALVARAESGPVRVIVQVDTPFEPEHELDAAAVAAQRAAIVRTQDAVIALIDAASAVRLRTLPLLALTASRADLDRLAGHPAVLRVDEDVLLQPVLAESLQLVRAPLVWQAGFDGTGWSVAVLDTGAEATHPMLAAALVAEACFSTNDPSMSAAWSVRAGPRPAPCRARAPRARRSSAVAITGRTWRVSRWAAARRGWLALDAPQG
jgi:hypothetical protein